MAASALGVAVSTGSASDAPGYVVLIERERPGEPASVADEWRARAATKMAGWRLYRCGVTRFDYYFGSFDGQGQAAAPLAALTANQIGCVVRSGGRGVDVSFAPFAEPAAWRLRF